MITKNYVNFLFLMGGSGCGKTTLGMKLEEFDPSKYYRSIEYSTRPIRDGEVNGFDYHFISEDEISELYEHGNLFESVLYQFPNKYGCDFSEIKENKTNIVVVSIEGFLTSLNTLKKFYPNSKAVLVNIINDCELDIKRDNRDPYQEERVNKAVIYSILDNLDEYHNGTFSKNVRYCEMKLSFLKTIRNDKEKCLEYFNGLFR